MALAVAVGVALGDTVAVAVAVGIGEGDIVAVGVKVGVAVGVPLKWHSVTTVLSTRQPSLEPLVSLAIRQRNFTLPDSKPATLTTVVIKPSELPLHARSPAIGLPRSVLIVRL